MKFNIILLLVSIFAVSNGIQSVAKPKYAKVEKHPGGKVPKAKKVNPVL